MKKKQIQTVFVLLISMMSLAIIASAQTGKENQKLSAKQQSIVTIAALTAKGDLPNLNKAINVGLDSGMTINEIKEVIVHLYAYCGFPRSINGLNTMIAVLEERKKRGITDPVGKAASPITDTGSKYERGKRNLSKLSLGTETRSRTETPRPENNQRSEGNQRIGYAQFSPEIEVFLKEHLFADIFDRDILTYQERELVTISVLTSLGNVEAQLRSHMGISLNNDISEEQQKQMLSIIETNIGKSEAETGRKVLASILISRNR